MPADAAFPARGGLAGREAAGAFASAVALEPRSREARLNLAIAQQELGELAAAQATLEALVGAHPQDYDGWIQLGLVRQDRRDLRGAQAALRSALACRPDAAPAAVNLGIVLQEDAQPDATRNVGYLWAGSG